MQDVGRLISHRENAMEELRIKYSKTGSLKYISHLDETRCFARAFARADIPLWHTEGYNPHTYMNFLLPLALGVESQCEFMDVKFSTEIDGLDLKERMNKTLPSGLQIIDVYPDCKSREEISSAQFIFFIKFTNLETACEKMKIILNGEEIMAQKSKKSGKKKIICNVNLKEKIYKSSVKCENNMVVIDTLLKAGVHENLSPILLFNTLTTSVGEDYDFYNIKKTNLFDHNMIEFY